MIDDLDACTWINIGTSAVAKKRLAACLLSLLIYAVLLYGACRIAWWSPQPAAFGTTVLVVAGLGISWAVGLSYSRAERPRIQITDKHAIVLIRRRGFRRRAFLRLRCPWGKWKRTWLQIWRGYDEDDSTTWAEWWNNAVEARQESDELLLQLLQEAQVSLYVGTGWDSGWGLAARYGEAGSQLFVGAEPWVAVNPLFFDSTLDHELVHCQQDLESDSLLREFNGEFSDWWKFSSWWSWFWIETEAMWFGSPICLLSCLPLCAALLSISVEYWDTPLEFLRLLGLLVS